MHYCHHAVRISIIFLETATRTFHLSRAGTYPTLFHCRWRAEAFCRAFRARREGLILPAHSVPNQTATPDPNGSRKPPLKTTVLKHTSYVVQRSPNSGLFNVRLNLKKIATSVFGLNVYRYNFTAFGIIIRAAESESRPELESVGVDRFVWSRGPNWSR